MDCLKNNTPPFEWELRKKLDPSYLERLASSEMEVKAIGKKKVHDEAKKKGKGKVLDSNFEGEDSRVLEHQEDRERYILPSKSLIDVQMRQLDVFPGGEVGSKGFQGTPSQQY
jgi:hypothetical protein